jgi:hypothetical protein
LRPEWWVANENGPTEGEVNATFPGHLRPQSCLAAVEAEDARNVLAQANVDQPKGTLNSPQQTYALNTNYQLLKPDAYKNLIIACRNGSPVRVSDIGKAIEGPENDLLAGWYNNQRAIILGIQHQPGAKVGYLYLHRLQHLLRRKGQPRQIVQQI